MLETRLYTVDGRVTFVRHETQEEQKLFQSLIDQAKIEDLKWFTFWNKRGEKRAFQMCHIVTIAYGGK